MKKQLKEKKFLFLLLWMTSLSVFAQTSSFRNIIDNGIVDFQVNCFFKDSQGYIWTGGTFRIQRFDGKSVKVYKVPPEVQKVNGIAEASEGTLYFATNKGLFLLKKNSSEVESVYSNLIKSDVKSLFIDVNNSIYIGTDNGLIIISDETVESIKVRTSDFPFNQILAIKPIGDNEFWLLTPGGLVSLNIKSKKTQHYPVLHETNNSYCTSIERINRVFYIGTKKAGLYAFDIDNQEIKPFLHVGNGSVTGLTTDGEDLYVGTSGTGVFHVSALSKQIVRSFNSSPDKVARLSSSMITTLMIDNFGILWVGTAEHLGFDYMFIKPKPFEIYQSNDYSTRSLAFDQFYIGDDFKFLAGLYSAYYISDEDGLLKKFEAGVGINKDLKPGRVKAIYPYKNQLIFGGENGIYSFNQADLQIKPFEPVNKLIKDADVNCITSNNKGDLLIGTSHGLFILDSLSDNLEFFNSTNSILPDDEVSYIYSDSKERVWICTNEGVCFWRDEENNFFKKDFGENVLNNSRIHHILEDDEGNFIFCYDVRNVMHINAELNQFKRICTEEDAGFTGLRILKTLQDREGNFWFIGSRGAIKANSSFTDYRQYSISEGLFEPYATDGHFDKNGVLWLSNNEGLYYSTQNWERLDANMAITDLRVNGKSVSKDIFNSIENDEVVVFNHNENNIEFEFALLDYTRSDLMVYEYKLLEADTSWNILRGLNSVRYKDLKPGEYTFRVRYNMDMDSTKEIHFEIQPLFTGFKILIIALLILVLMWLLYYTYQYRQKKRSVQVEEIVEEENKVEEKYKFNKVSKEEAELIVAKLRLCMEDKQMFLKEDLKISDLAQEVGCSNQTLSQVFNVFLSKKYYDYINQYRIQEFKRLVVESDHTKYTIRTLAQMSGFSSYTSFYRTFKEQIGMTPNTFVKEHLSNKKL